MSGQTTNDQHFKGWQELDLRDATQRSEAEMWTMSLISPPLDDGSKVQVELWSGTSEKLGTWKCPHISAARGDLGVTLETAIEAVRDSASGSTHLRTIGKVGPSIDPSHHDALKSEPYSGESSAPPSSSAERTYDGLTECVPSNATHFSLRRPGNKVGNAKVCVATFYVSEKECGTTKPMNTTAMGQLLGLHEATVRKYSNNDNHHKVGTRAVRGTHASRQEEDAYTASPNEIEESTPEFGDSTGLIIQPRTSEERVFYEIVYGGY